VTLLSGREIDIVGQEFFHEMNALLVNSARSNGEAA
jgi:hypothetical protein